MLKGQGPRAPQSHQRSRLRAPRPPAEVHTTATPRRPPATAGLCQLGGWQTTHRQHRCTARHSLLLISCPAQLAARLASSARQRLPGACKVEVAELLGQLHGLAHHALLGKVVPHLPSRTGDFQEDGGETRHPADTHLHTLGHTTYLGHSIQAHDQVVINPGLMMRSSIKVQLEDQASKSVRRPPTTSNPASAALTEAPKRANHP